MTDATAVVRDPALIPHAMPDNAQMAFRRVTPAGLRAASFLDGREPVGEPAGSWPVADLLAAVQAEPAPAPVPMIFHVSFCGSTLLSRLLDVPGQTIVYREPAVQIALADRLAAGQSVTDALAVSTQLLARPVGGARAIVKPTNWANVLLPAWTGDVAVAPLFITMQPPAFLTAVFRGGRDRIAFTIRAAEHFAKVFADGPALIAAAVGADRVPLGQAARLTLVSLELQLRLFDAARAQLPAGGRHSLDYADIQRNPRSAATFAATALGLDNLVSSIGDDVASHAKDPSQRYSRSVERQADAAVMTEHGAVFEAALLWADKRNITSTDGRYWPPLVE